MKDLKRFIRKHRELLITGSIVGLVSVIVVLSLAYLLADILIPGSVFLVAAMLMFPLALNYSKQKKRSKGVYVFFGIAAALCVLAALIQMLMPAPQV